MPEPSLTNFLLARIAEDENGTRPGTIQNGVFSAIIQYYGLDEADDTDQEQASEITSAIMTYLRPRVLADSEAKRHIVTSFAASSEPLTARTAEMAVVRMVLKLLAAVYADHPDYNETWRP